MLRKKLLSLLLIISYIIVTGKAEAINLTSYCCPETNLLLPKLSHAERLELMQGDTLLKVVTLYTIETYLLPHLQQSMIDPETTQEQKEILASIIEHLTSDLLIEYVNNQRALAYAFHVYHKEVVCDNHEIQMPEETYGALLAKCFELILTHAKSIGHAHSWITRVISYNPYLNYYLPEENVTDFYYQAPVQGAALNTWHTMWQAFAQQRYQDR